MLEPREMVALVDLTSLTGEETDADIAALCAQAQTTAGPVAAVCVYGQYVTRAVGELDGTGIPVAAVANFPEGDLDEDRAVRETEQAVADGAREVDVVLPWRAFLNGDRAGAMAVGAAARDALAVGADFIKTSTGKLQPAATLPAAAVMLEAVRDHGQGGFKASGGIRTADDAAAYLELVDALFGPDWATPGTFRFGASSLLADLLRER